MAGDGNTYDGCYGMYSVSLARALLPFLATTSARARLGRAHRGACRPRASTRPPPITPSVQVLSSTEYLLPNKHDGDWEGNSTFKLSQLVADRQGLAFTWGPQEACAKWKEGTCDYSDGMRIEREWCEKTNGPLPEALAAPVYGGGKEVCSRSSLP